MAVTRADGTVEWAGAVLAAGVEVGHFNDGYDTSYGARVWDVAVGAPRVVHTHSTMSVVAPRAEVDATPEARAAYEAYEERGRQWAEALRQLRAEEVAEREARLPRKGRRVRVARGRKVPVGTTGLVIWEGEGRFGARIGIKDDAGTVHWTAASNAEALPGEAARGLVEAAALAQIPRDRNRYAGPCGRCGARVEAGAGRRAVKRAGRWETECLPVCAVRAA